MPAFRRLAAMTGLVVVGTGSIAGPVAPAAAVVSAAVQPLLVHSTTYTTDPPTTEQCEQQFGIACYSANQLQAAYNMPSLFHDGLDGTGQTIAIVDAFGSPTIAQDVATFSQQYGLPQPQLTVIQPAGPVPPFNPNSIMADWAFETTLDVEYAHAMAPGANILLVETPVAETEGLAGIPQIVKAENYVVNHHLAGVISQSFGATENTFPSAKVLRQQRSAFLNAAKQNVTVIASSGDAGSTSGRNAKGTKYYTTRVTSWPSSDPLVTSVGGTQLHLDDNGNRAAADNVWNDGNELGGPLAGGGGRSQVFGRPSFQDGVAGIVGPHRGTPDISMSAAVDGGAIVYLSFLPGAAGYYVVGGTSEAAPLFAGVVAIADQTAMRSLGDLNPALYALGSGAPGLPDITTGNNTVSFTQNGKDVVVPGYLAKPGYDLASGLGTVDGYQLVSELSGGVLTSRRSP